MVTLFVSGVAARQERNPVESVGSEEKRTHAYLNNKSPSCFLNILPGDWRQFHRLRLNRHTVAVQMCTQKAWKQAAPAGFTTSAGVLIGLLPSILISVGLGNDNCDAPAYCPWQDKRFRLYRVIYGTPLAFFSRLQLSLLVDGGTSTHHHRGERRFAPTACGWPAHTRTARIPVLPYHVLNRRYCDQTSSDCLSGHALYLGTATLSASPPSTSRLQGIHACEDVNKDSKTIFLETVSQQQLGSIRPQIMASSARSIFWSAHRVGKGICSACQMFPRVNRISSLCSSVIIFLERGAAPPEACYKHPGSLHHEPE